MLMKQLKYVPVNVNLDFFPLKKIIIRISEMTRGYSLDQDLGLLINNPKYGDIEILCGDEYTIVERQECKI